MNKSYSARERAHLQRVKELPCGVCGASAPSEAHHIDQALPFACIPLCASCHRDGRNGLHGQKAMWKVMKKSELSVLNDTIRLLTT